MKKEFQALYNMMANSNKVENMHTFGNVHKEMMHWFIQNKPELAQEWLDKLESIKWKNYLSPKEAEKIVAGMNPKAPCVRLRQGLCSLIPHLILKARILLPGRLSKEAI